MSWRSSRLTGCPVGRQARSTSISTVYHPAPPGDLSYETARANSLLPSQQFLEGYRGCRICHRLYRRRGDPHGCGYRCYDRYLQRTIHRGGTEVAMGPDAQHRRQRCTLRSTSGARDRANKRRRIRPQHGRPHHGVYAHVEPTDSTDTASAGKGAMAKKRQGHP